LGSGYQLDSDNLDLSLRINSEDLFEAVKHSVAKLIFLSIVVDEAHLVDVNIASIDLFERLAILIHLCTTVANNHFQKKGLLILSFLSG
jgi:hypothetical protein